MVEDDVYRFIISILQDVKLCEGPLALSSTLKRHPQTKKWLHDYQFRRLVDLESNLAF